MRGINGTYWHQNKKGGQLEMLKNRWADNGVSPLMFFHDYFKKYSYMTYDEFLELINLHETINAELEKAISDFLSKSV